MAEIELPVIVTAVADASTEGFIAGTLFNQGWNVVYRALDASSLEYFFENEAGSIREILLIFSPDLPGLTPLMIGEYQRKVRQVVGFATSPTLFPEYPGLLRIPQEPAELLKCVRGFVRAPLLRAPNLVSAKLNRARVIAIASPTGATGCTTVAINLAMELSATGKETLLVDADVRSPSIATLLGLHKLDQELTRPIAPQLSASEFTQSRMEYLSKYLDHLVTNFDFVILDLGSIDEISDSLTDRRWSATLVHWSCEHAEEIIFVGRSDPLSMHRFEVLAKSLAKLTIHAKVSLLLNMKPVGRKGSAREAHFFSAIASLHAYRTITLPKDVNAVRKAEEERATLIEVSERSGLRRAIAKLAVGLQA
jgi:Flp pilus assembly CpaE family ATPase